MAKLFFRISAISALGVLFSFSSAVADNSASSPSTVQKPVQASTSSQTPSPWLTGPLIAPPGTVLQRGHFDLENYLYVTVDTGTYDSHWNSHSTPNFYSINPQFFYLFGLTSWMDIQITPQIVYNITEGQSSVHFGDLPIGFDFQLYSASSSGYFPGIKLTLKETFPTGKYQHLNPHKKGTDSSGAGTYGTNFNLLFYKVYHIKNLHFLSATFSSGYTVNTSVNVHGLNTYGGGHGTNGRVHPGSILEEILSFEYSFNQNWVFAIDNVYTHTNRNRFSGKPGPASVGGPSSEQISFAPAIEYNFSSNFGIIAGAWVTAWGRNSTRFRSGVVNFNYTY